MPILAQAVLASHNAGKVREFQGWLQPWIGELLPLPATIEIAETADSFVGNACLKAITAAQELGKWAIADDSGLAVHALEGARGSTRLATVRRMLSVLSVYYGKWPVSAIAPLNLFVSLPSRVPMARLPLRPKDGVQVRF